MAVAGDVVVTFPLRARKFRGSERSGASRPGRSRTCVVRNAACEMRNLGRKALTVLALVATCARTAAGAEIESFTANRSGIGNVSLEWGCPGERYVPSNITAHTRGFSQSREDITIARCLFCDVCSRTKRQYIELGALQGVKYSNTLVLETKLNWHGLLIEGHPGNAPNLIASRGRSGRNVIIPEAVCDPIGTATFTGPAALGTAGIRKAMSPEYMKVWGERRHRFRSNFEVPCRPLRNMIAMARLKHVHFFSLDVEGAELEVLQSFDWTVPVFLWCVELRQDSKSEMARALLTQHGYVETKRLPLSDQNSYFIHSSLNMSLDQRLRSCGCLQR